MTAAADLLDRCRAVGIDLAAGPGGALLWEADADPPADLLADLAAQKAGLLAVLGGEAGEGPTPAAPAVARWDQAEADRLLAELRSAVGRARWREFGGKFPAHLGNVVGDLLAVAEGYVANREAEAARGWDAMRLLRGVRPTLEGVLAGGRRR